MATRKKESLESIEINQEWCKRCGICVAYCPKDVFTADGEGTVAVANQDACILCELCERMCPDLAISLVLAREAVEPAATKGGDA